MGRETTLIIIGVCILITLIYTGVQLHHIAENLKDIVLQGNFRDT